MLFVGSVVGESYIKLSLNLTFIPLFTFYHISNTKHSPLNPTLPDWLLAKQLTKKT